MAELPPGVFVSHEATRTGAPRVLLHFLGWLRRNTSVDFEVVLLRDGPVRSEFEALAPVHVLAADRHWHQLTLAERAVAKLVSPAAGDRARQLRQRWQASRLPVRGGLVYLNSSLSLPLAGVVGAGGKGRAPKVVSHIHELDTGLRHSVGDAGRRLLGERVDHVVAVSNCVRDNLVERWGVAPDRVSRHYEFVAAGEVTADPVAAAAARASAGIPADALVVGAAGMVEWRKGPDLFVHLARRVPAEIDGRPVHFVWVGGRPAGADVWPVDEDVARSGLTDRVHFVGEHARPFEWYRGFDVFALPSREDPYPLVGLETALLGVPMVTMDNGGMPELVARGTEQEPVGFTAPYLDVATMAEQITRLLRDPELRAAVGHRAGQLVRAEHDVESAAPALLATLQRVVGAG